MRFLSRLRAYGVDQGLIESLKPFLATPIRAERGTHIVVDGTPSGRLIFVEEGWLAVQNTLPDGRAVIGDIVLPGEIAGLHELAWVAASNDTVALTPLRGTVVPRSRLGHILETVPNAAGVLLTLMAMRSIAAGDRHAMTLRASGRERLIYLFLDLHARQTVAAPAEWIDMPLTQGHIADVVGLTNVHVSGLMKGLEAEGLLERRRGAIRLVDVPALRAAVGYRDRWSTADFSWTGALGARGDLFAGPRIVAGAIDQTG